MNALNEFAPLMDAVVSHFNKGVIVIDNEGNILFHNPAAEEMLGVPGMESMNDIHDIAGVDLQHPPATISKHQSLMTQTAGDDQHEFNQRITRNGETRVVHVHASAVPVPGYADPFGLLIMGDITDKHRLGSIPQEERNKGIITQDARMLEIMELIAQIAPTKASVLLQGESGTGKSMIARMIHRQSTRRDRPLVEINCAAIPENLLESEMFGHVKGAFTGADQSRPGRLQETDGGTLFLDEISELPLHLQPKILKAIEEQSFQMVGSDKTVHVDVRIIAASNQDLRKLVEKGRFRADLYYRLAVIPLDIPALRDRAADIPLLANFLSDQLASQGYPSDLEYTRETMHLMTDYPWPGNVRELANAVEHGMILADKGQVTPNALPINIRDYFSTDAAPANPHDLNEVDPERKEILDALYQTKWNRSEAARLLGIDRSTLWRRMHRLKLI